MPSFWDRIEVDGIEMELYSGVPEGTGLFPAVVVAQAAGGLDEFIQTIVDRLPPQPERVLYLQERRSIAPYLINQGGYTWLHPVDQRVSIDGLSK